MRSHDHKRVPVRRREIPENPYAVLGVDRETGESEIRRAYLELVRKHSPERDPEGFKRVRAAYERVSTPEARAATRLSMPELPQGSDLTAAEVSSGPAIAGIPLSFLFAFDPWSDLSEDGE